MANVLEENELVGEKIRELCMAVEQALRNEPGEMLSLMVSFGGTKAKMTANKVGGRAGSGIVYIATFMVPPLG